MANWAIGESLKILARFAGSDVARRFGLQEPANRLLHTVVKGGFKTIEQAVRRFEPVRKLAAPLRPQRADAGPSPRFDLTLSEDQKMMRETLRRFSDSVLRPAAEAADEACEPPAELLKQAEELGLALLAIPEELDGACETRSPVSNMLIAEELSRGDMGLAVALLAPLSVIHTLVEWGTAEQQATYLPPFIEEPSLAAAIAMNEPRALFDPFKLRTRAHSTADGYQLSGEKSLVPLGRSAAFWLIAAELDGQGPQLFIVPRGTPGVTVESDPSMGLRAADISRLKLSDVQLPASALLGGQRGEFDYRSLVDRSRVSWSAITVGCSQSVLDYVLPYCNERQAFGEPISNRQSVAFMIADMGIEIAGMRMLTFRAAGLLERGRDCSREAYLAALICAEKAMQIGTDGVQLLGGHGFIKDHPVERWYRHLRAAGVVEGGMSL